LSKKILLINYSFPPHPGVGGRRWAKLSKYFSESEHEIYVLRARIFGKEQSIFETNEGFLNIYHFPVYNFKEYLQSKFSHPFLKKGLEKFFFVLAKFFSPGNPYDVSIWWNKPAFKVAQSIIEKHHIKNVIISCPPYKIMHEFSKLKVLYPNINLILDYRDIWTIGQQGKGFFNLISDRQYKVECDNEKAAILLADKIVTVAESMSENIKRLFPDKNIFTIRNGYDRSDAVIANIDLKRWIDSDKINICYGGSIVSDSNVYALQFMDFLYDIKCNNSILYKKLNIQIFGNINVELENKLKQLDLEIITINEMLPNNQIVEVYSKFDFLLMFLNPYYTYAYISKFYDYLLAKKPIICFSDKGDFSEFLEANDLGRNVDPSTELNYFSNYIQGKLEFIYNVGFENDSFDYANISKEYQLLLI
jgi:hypothetical protein